MNEQQLLAHIVRDPQVMTGKPVIKGTRLTVEYVLKLLASGMTMTEIVDEYAGLTIDDVRACLMFAMQAIDTTCVLPLATTGNGDAFSR